jgi:tetratricopeptide (TPR) repeat protein
MVLNVNPSVRPARPEPVEGPAGLSSFLRAGTVLLLGLCAASSKTPTVEAPADQAIEALLPTVEASLRRGQSRESMAAYATRVDWVGRLLWAWSNIEDQTAWEAFHTLAIQDPPIAWGYAGMARVYLRWKIWDQAEATVTRALALSPSVAEFWVLKGDVARARGSLDAADAAYRQALKLYATPFAEDGLGLLSLGALRPDEARAHFQAAIAIWPEDFVAGRGLADLALSAQDWRGALTQLERLEKLAPQDLPLRLEAIELRKKLGDSVVADAEAAVKLGAHDPALLKLLLAGYQGAGRTDDELRLLRELDLSGAIDASGYRRLGDIEAASGREVEALEDYRKATILAPKDVEVLRAHAHLLVRRGKYVEAIEDSRQLQAMGQEPGEELDQVVKVAALAPKPITGKDIGAINSALGAALHKLYQALLDDKPALAGTLKLQVTVGSDGRATLAEYKENSVGSPELAANLYWNARDARYPHTPARYVFTFSLQPQPR